MPNLKFLALFVPEILRGPKILKKRVTCHVTPTLRLLRNFAFFSLVLTAVHLCAKLDISSFIHPRDIRGSQKSKIGSHVPHMTPFDPILHFSLVLTKSISLPNLMLLAFTVPEILGGSKKFKIESRDPYVTPFDLTFHFVSLVRAAVHLCAKFEVSNFYRYGDIKRSQNSISGSRDPHVTNFDLILHFFR